MEICIRDKLSNFSKNFILKVMSLLFLIVTILSFSIIYRHNKFYSTYPPRIDFIYQLKSKITDNYWQLGEILEGANNTNVQQVMQNLKNNFKNLKYLRDGNKKVKR